MNDSVLIELLRARLDDLLAIYAFGSQVHGTADKQMVGYRNIAVHGYQALQLPIAVAMITRHLDEFLDYSRCILLKDARQGLRPVCSLDSLRGAASKAGHGLQHQPHRQIHRLHILGQRPQRDVVHARLGDHAQGAVIDAAGSFELGAAGGESYGFVHILE